LNGRFNFKLKASRYPLFSGALSSLGSLPVFRASGIPGYDASSHVAKTAFLVYSFSHGNFTGWSEFWYSGFQLFYTYSPLTYLLAAFFGLPFNSVVVGMKIVVALSFFLSGVGAFLLARNFKISNIWSVVAALLYSITSPHILTLFFKGSLTYSLAFALAPFLFLALRYAIRKQTICSIIYLGMIIGLLIISNETTAYVIFFPIIAYLVISTSRSKAIKTALIVMSSSLIGLLSSAFWLIPYLKIDLSGQGNLLAESKTGAYQVGNVIYWYTFFQRTPGNTIAGDLGWIVVIPALASLIFLRKREEYALYGAGIVILFLTLGASLIPIFYKIPFVLALQFSWRFLIGDVLFLAPLSALFFSRLGQRIFPDDKPPVAATRKTTAIALILIMAATPIAVLLIENSYSNLETPQLNPNDPNQAAALNFLSSQNPPGNYYRILTYDRYYETIPEYTMKGSIDGWYDQVTTQAYRNFTFSIYFCDASNRTLNALRLLGVRYVVIETAYGGAAINAFKSYNSSGSPFGHPVFNNSEVSIFQVPNSQLVYVSQSIPNSVFSFSQSVNCNKPIPSAPSEDDSNISYSISNLNFDESKISFDIDLNQSAYVLISSAYSSGWLATDNGSSIPVLLSPPGLPVVHVPRGNNQILLYYSGAPDALLAGITSLVTFAGAMFLLFLPRIHRSRRSRRENPRP
jgi:hypothetical protein